MKFINRLKTVALSLPLVLMLGACSGGGGGRDSSTPASPQDKIAYFIDSPVAGLAYKSQSKEGITQSDGAFEYASSDTNVTFKAGEITLGTINVAKINTDSKLFIQDLLGVERDNITNPSVLKIASFLQSLDSGSNANGITLNSNDLTNLTEVKNIEDINVSRQLAFTGKTLKAQDEVKEHLGDTIRKNGIALYNYTPQSTDSNITTLKNVITNGTLNATDKNDNFLEFTIVSYPTNGTVELIADTNSFKYTPDTEFVGSDSFTFKAYDGEKYSQVATVNIVVEDVVISTGDTTPPTAPTIVSLDAQKNSLTLFWLNATDETTPTAELRYEVHLSTDANFTADASTLKQTLVNTLESDVSGLNANTLYYVKVKALDGANNSVLSSENSIQTLNEEVVLAPTVVVKKARELHLENAVEDSDTLVFEDSLKSEVPNAGDILVGNAEDSYLKKVVSVDKNDSTTKVVVEDVAITDVVQSAKLSSKVVLFGTANSGTAPSSSMRRSISFKTNNTKETRTTWGSGRFSVVDTQKLSSTSSSPSKAATKSNGDFSVTVVQDNIVVAQNDRVKIDISAQMLQEGIDDDLEFISIKVKSFDHPSKSPIYQDIVSTINKHDISAYFSWTPYSADISDEEFTLTYEVCAKDTLDDGITDSVSNSCETIKSKIKVISRAETGEAGKTTNTFNSKKEFTNSVTLDFSPTLTVDTEVVDGDIKSAEVSIKGELDFNVLTTFKYSVADTKTYEHRMTEKTYYSVYALGPLPVYQKVTFTIDAQLEATANGSIEAISDLKTNFSMKTGVTYDGEKWSKVPFDPTLKKDYTATFKAAGGVNVKVRLIPNIEVEFFTVATAGFSVEPWLEGDLRASATATFNTDFADADTMGIHRVENLQLYVGLEGKVYADLTVWKINLAHYPSEQNDANGDGKKTIFNPTLNVFDIPKIALSDNGVNICSDSPYKLNATITNPDSLVKNNFVEQNIKWIVFPSAGATITPSFSNIKEATFEFNKQDNYTVYMVGNSEKLGTVLGKQYETFNISTYGCTIVVEDTTPPVFTTGSSATADVNENQKSAITLNATDETSSVTYSISGADSPSFDVNATTGVVTFKTAPDYEATPTKTSYVFVATAKDEALNEATQNITINLLDVLETPLDTTKPIITILGSNPLTMFTGDSYIDAGATAVDDIDGSLGVTSQGVADPQRVGTYTILYSVQDSAGNEANATRVVYVIEKTGSITHNGFTYGEVTSPYTGRVWLDRNLGALQVCTALNDTACYGDYYQWGRNSDGHEKSVSNITSTQATNINSTGTDFITDTGTYNYDWIMDLDTNGSLRSSNWSKTDGNSVCPLNYRVPTITELSAENIGNRDEAYTNLLIPSSGYRYSHNGVMDDVDSISRIWSVTIENNQAKYFGVDANSASVYNSGGNAMGRSVRCIKHIEPQNIAPTAVNQNITVEQDSIENIITLSGSDADSDPLTYTIIKSPLNGTLSGTAPNKTYTPTTGYSGVDSFTYKVNDGTSDSEVATVNITINATQTPSNSTIKKTGQTKSYDVDGNEVTNNSLKDDAYYQKGITPNYTRASDIVTDELTGLMWQDDEAVSSNRKQWLTSANYDTCSNDTSSPACYDTSGDTAATYCSDLSLGGHTDWRLPTSTELEGILDYSKYHPAIDTTYFNNVSSNHYWSSTTYEVNKDNAWIVFFSYGYVYDNRKGNNYYVRCVRDGQ